jgi:hypothetical protein
VESSTSLTRPTIDPTETFPLGVTATADGLDHDHGQSTTNPPGSQASSTGACPGSLTRIVILVQGRAVPYEPVGVLAESDHVCQIATAAPHGLG